MCVASWHAAVIEITRIASIFPYISNVILRNEFSCFVLGAHSTVVHCSIIKVNICITTWISCEDQIATGQDI